MPDVDKILEAEQTIQNIADELAKMRDANSLLRDTNKKSEAVISSAEHLTHEVHEFSQRSSELLARLDQATTDFAKLPEMIRTEVLKVAVSVSENTKEISISNIQVRNHIESLHTKTRQISTLAYAILSLIIAISMGGILFLVM